MADKRPALGRGLSALIPDASLAAPPPASDRPLEVDIDRLRPNGFQPRLGFDEARLDELAQSIRTNGVIQPVVVRRLRDGEGYEIIAGERRWRAAQRAGLLRIPVIVRDVPDAKLLEVALIENIQRDDLNPVEEARAYKRLADDFNLTQEAIAEAVGKDRSSVANCLRLLRLPVEVLNDLSAGTLTMGHARALLSLPDAAGQRRAARDVVARGLSVRDTELLVKKLGAPPATRRTPAQNDANTRAAEERLRFALGTPVRIARKGDGGRIEIEFRSEAELNRVYDRIVGT
ncbi:MAG TPA: ParB/RepB/Spo0J family partition protein [Vicinamibacterales bacterium]|nr:ParB/RepB/Spo0J family partition protein [Vicinamibacterales bacterium]